MVKVVHVMSDGSIKQDITGTVIPFIQETELAYKTVADIDPRGGQIYEKLQAGA